MRRFSQILLFLTVVTNICVAQDHPLGMPFSGAANAQLALLDTAQESPGTAVPEAAPVQAPIVPMADGQQTAKDLNAQYEDQSNVCPDNKAAFYCNGVFIRTVDDSPNFRAWNPSPGAVRLGGVSFSYMRDGLDMNRLQAARTQGLILSTAAQFEQAGGYPLKVLCSYPYDAGTVARTAKGCGEKPGLPGGGSCLGQGIVTLDAWREHFQKYPVSSNRYHHQCSFDTDPASFSLSMLARENPSAESPDMLQNEIMIETWPQNTNNLPIKAFFYFLSNTRAIGLAGAQNIQKDFFKHTHRLIPIVRVTPNVTMGDVFSYRQEDQALDDSGSPTAAAAR